MSVVEVIQWGPERARAGPWRGDSRVAYLSPVPDAPVPSAAFVGRCLDALGQRGFRSVVTGALTPAEQAGFLAAGFGVHERLHLLAHDLVELPEPSATHAHRRARRRDRAQVLEIDHAAFDPFWRLDGSGLDEALGATPTTRFRVGCESDRVVAYAVTGRAGRRGYVQRVAVDPAAHGRGWGTALVIDSLTWLRRRGVDHAVVNTQLDNGGALRLYERLGFRRQALGLDVLGRELT